MVCIGPGIPSRGTRHGFRIEINIPVEIPDNIEFLIMEPVSI
jgi:hypothetical protein